MLVAFSRVVLTQHYMSDVVFASFLGTMVAIYLHQYYFKSKEL
jgi:membrane-associated phospholipid phosphatase